MASSSSSSSSSSPPPLSPSPVPSPYSFSPLPSSSITIALPSAAAFASPLPSSSSRTSPSLSPSSASSSFPSPSPSPSSSSPSSSPSLYVPRRILLTGGAGFIGSSLCLYLLGKYEKYRVIVLDKLDVCSSLLNLYPLLGGGGGGGGGGEPATCSSSSSPLCPHPNFRFIRGDICDAPLVCRILLEECVDTLIHMAAETHVDNSFGNSLLFTASNVLGTHTLLEAAKSCPTVKRFIHVSTDEVYGEIQQHVTLPSSVSLSSSPSAPSPSSPSSSSPPSPSSPSSRHDIRCTESHVLNPTNPYSATKVGAEYLVKSYQYSFGLPCIITRGNNVYGPRQYPEKVIPKFINLLLRGEPCPIHGHGRNKRNYLHISDVCSAFDVILHRGVTGEIYNIGGDCEYETIEILRMLIRVFRRHFPRYLDAAKRDDEYILHVKDRAFNDLRYHIDAEKLKRLGWQAKEIDMEAGLVKTIEWFISHPNHWGSIDSALLPHPFLHAATGEQETQAEEQQISHILSSLTPIIASRTVDPPLADAIPSFQLDTKGSGEGQ